jgi:CMP-N-acetylneuraminic acid synthetase
MKTVAFVPMRSGSKGIVNKNISIVAGKPLYYWALSALYRSNVDQIVVSTDSVKYHKMIEIDFPNIKVIGRTPEVSKDGASTESTVLEYLNNFDVSSFFDILLVQLTNPLITTSDINSVLKMREEEDYDSILSVVDISERFLWKENGQAINYDFLNRKRRQDLSEELYIENGSFYLTGIERFKSTKSRLSGTIGYYFMSKGSLFEMDSLEDIEVISKLRSKKND